MQVGFVKLECLTYQMMKGMTLCQYRFYLKLFSIYCYLMTELERTGQLLVGVLRLIAMGLKYLMAKRDQLSVPIVVVIVVVVVIVPVPVLVSVVVVLPESCFDEMINTVLEEVWFLFPVVRLVVFL
ncbi:hypothetical protein WICMUC_001988 [Wickerhamomyces mucosus]|uniref:Uncharacterized protein n=1 Tax=Wickerhamomyces mucosus TaxID=1378264 RepID=A0A9P8PQS6_9ASCO|nr:hypothetical protein WICMUC_001988 [Wickerhamomyces mucosus]